MTAWTELANALVAVGAKPFATTVQALRDNVRAAAEGATGGPALSSSWHPYDMVNVGDGATGAIYDFAVDGLKTSVVANFANGYDYLIRLDRLSSNAAFTLSINTVAILTGVAAVDAISGTIEITAPTLTNYPKWAMLHLRTAAGSTGPAAFTSTAGPPYYGLFNFSALASGLSSITLAPSAGSFDAGRVLLYRRRNFMFG